MADLRSTIGLLKKRKQALDEAAGMDSGVAGKQTPSARNMPIITKPGERTPPPPAWDQQKRELDVLAEEMKKKKALWKKQGIEF